MVFSTRLRVVVFHFAFFRFSDCSVSVALPLPLPLLRGPWPRGAPEAGLMEVLLEEWLLRPLRALTSVRPAAEFYRLKHRLMDSPSGCKAPPGPRSHSHSIHALKIR